MLLDWNASFAFGIAVNYLVTASAGVRCLAVCIRKCQAILVIAQFLNQHPGCSQLSNSVRAVAVQLSDTSAVCRTLACILEHET